jgi:hypothetical protein
MQDINGVQIADGDVAAAMGWAVVRKASLATLGERLDFLADKDPSLHALYRAAWAAEDDLNPEGWTVDQLNPGLGFRDRLGQAVAADWYQKLAAGDLDEAALGELGVARIAAAPSPPDGQRTASLQLALDGEAPVWAATFVTLPSLVEMKDAKCAEIRNLRWLKEVGGIVLNGVAIRTDENSQTKINGAVTLLMLDPEMAGIDNWEATPGNFVTLPRATMEAVGMAVGQHIQACFTRSRELSDLVVNANSRAAVEAVDITVGWPNQNGST